MIPGTALRVASPIARLKVACSSGWAAMCSNAVVPVTRSQAGSPVRTVSARPPHDRHTSGPANSRTRWRMLAGSSATIPSP